MSKEDRDSEENNGRDKNFYRHTRLDVLRRHRRRDGSFWVRNQKTAPPMHTSLQLST